MFTLQKRNKFLIYMLRRPADSLPIFLSFLSPSLFLLLFSSQSAHVCVVFRQFQCRRFSTFWRGSKNKKVPYLCHIRIKLHPKKAQ